MALLSQKGPKWLWAAKKALNPITEMFIEKYFSKLSLWGEQQKRLNSKFFFFSQNTKISKWSIQVNQKKLDKPWNFVRWNLDNLFRGRVRFYFGMMKKIANYKNFEELQKLIGLTLNPEGSTKNKFFARNAFFFQMKKFKQIFITKIHTFKS